MSAVARGESSQPVDISGTTRRRWSQHVVSLLNVVGMLLVLGALVLLFGSMSKNFLTTATFQTIANQVPSLMLVSIGMTYVIITAGIDLSVGSVMALASAVLGIALVDWKLPLPLALLLALAAGAACGFLTGFISVWWRIPSFIVSLAMLEAARGGAYLVSNSETKYIGESIEKITEPIGKTGLSFGFFIAAVVALLAQFVLSRTIFGRYMIAIGTNEEAVRLSGINSRPTKIWVFAISGLLAGLSGVFNTSRLGSADPNAGVGWELSAIAAVIIGGTSLMGGRGSVLKTILGVLIIAVLEAGLSQTGATEPVKRLVTGSVILLAVIVDSLRVRRVARAQHGDAG